ncbi:DnaJ domain-containing protein [Magnetospirillum fulvum]|uniref:DnaJ domain-containing protein n=1 Tax=Magnetospirillum fulvum TaxID=1082 RepID=A0A1H6GXQ5_MAGFU|nr:DnaJ domain-containing protein [Magnetospirillum fulvum]SEH28161.1 DnaJ domain-containing protein [Magnetospirillum fulvum]
MLAWILLGAAGVLLGLAGLGWLTRQPPGKVKSALIAVAMLTVAAVGLALLLSGRLAGLVALIAGLSPWLSRATRLHQIWRLLRGGRSARSAPPPPSSSGDSALTRAQAYEILGLPPHASREEIRAAHLRLMQANHPDRGGSTWIAARLNQARDLLLG